MRRRRGLLLAACLLALVMPTAAGCSSASTTGSNGKPAASGTIRDGAGEALAAARIQMESLAPDAMPIMVGSAGVALRPPPEQWKILFASRGTGRTYSVTVSHGKAERPRDVSGLKLSSYALANVIPYDTLKVGSDAAFKQAKAELAKTGKVPAQAMQSIALVEIPALPEYKPTVWQVSFLNGTSTVGMRQAEVDAMSGAVTVTK